ncbi:helix-turn-helix domain-containing protein [Glycomyces arizonensis]|uniref:helix-turn-helix domain-containing protein n=1 Tax=Glycomyces arizonensis TaxID=256035 RepID=UPI00047B604E|nr:helix-turn-helix transcriptional regulator [Glycomyces arizonensis]
MDTPLFVPVDLPDDLWGRDTMRQALAARDMTAVFRLVQQYGGLTQSRIGIATGLGQGRTNEIFNGKRKIASIEVLERIADGLAMPDRARHLLGLAPAIGEPEDSEAQAARIGITRVFASQASAAKEIRDAAWQAAKVDLLAVRALGLIGLNDSLLREPLTTERPQPVRARVILLDPDSSAAAHRAKEIGESAESFTAGIRLSVARLRELIDHPYLDLHVALYSTLPTWRIIRLDNLIYLSMFNSTTEGHQSSIYRLTAAQYNMLHVGFTRQFEDLWTTADRLI